MAVFTQKVFDYLNRKHRGGLANQQGIRYEHYFATFRIAELILDYIDNNNESIISAQVEGFVDDIYIHSNNEHWFYQLKTSARLSWSKGIGSLFYDFRCQICRCSKKYENFKLFLVVCYKNLATKLASSVPPKINKYTRVIWFPYCESTSLMFQSNSDFKRALTDICYLSDPGVDKLDSLAANIVGIWVSSNNKNLSVKSIYKKLTESTTSFIKRPGLSSVSPVLANILNKIPHFEYWVEQGYLSWRYTKNDNGIIPYSIDSEKFRNIEQKILEQKPDTFSALEELI